MFLNFNFTLAWTSMRRHHQLGITSAVTLGLLVSILPGLVSGEKSKPNQAIPASESDLMTQPAKLSNHDGVGSHHVVAPNINLKEVALSLEALLVVRPSPKKHF
jgi:hypothetical protein